MPMQAQLWTVAGLAVELNCDRPTLAKKLQDLEADEEKRDGRGLVRRFRMARVVAHLYVGGGDPGDFDNQRERLAAAQAEKVEMENDVRRGRLADMGDVHAVWSDHIMRARSRILALPSKLAPQLVNVGSAREAEIAVKRECDAALTELANGEEPVVDDGEALGAAADADGFGVV